MKRILITGENSYIGNSFYNYINNYYFDNYQIDKISLKNINISDLDLSNYDVILHVAGIAHSDYGKISKEKSKVYYKINTDLTFQIAEKSKKDKVKQFIFLSSIIIYGENNPIGKKKIITFDTLPKPLNAYGQSKLKAEEMLKKISCEDFKVSIIRLPMIYGDGCKGNFRLLEKMSKKILLFPYIENEKSVLHINNLCRFLNNVIEESKQGIYFPQDDEYMNTSKMVYKLAQKNNKNIILLPGFAWLLKIISFFTPLVNKAFGNLVYDKNLKFMGF